MKTTTPTPRTDEAFKRIREMMIMDAVMIVHMADFARTLERELMLAAKEKELKCANILATENFRAGGLAAAHLAPNESLKRNEHHLKRH
jgi:hypothetical protein